MTSVIPLPKSCETKDSAAKVTWWTEFLAILFSLSVVTANAGTSRNAEFQSGGSGAAIWDDVAVIGDLVTESARVYSFNGSAWVLTQTLQASDGVSGDLFGRQVAIWDNVIAVGAPGVNQGSSALCGAVYVYRFNGTDWIEEAKLEPSSSSCDAGEVPQFGYSVAIFDDAIAVGSPFENVFFDPNLVAAGYAHIFRFSGANWLLEDSIASPSQLIEEFGKAVDIWSDRVIIGAPDNFEGVAAIYRNNGFGNWNSEWYFGAPPGTYRPNFGRDVAIWGGVAAVTADSPPSGCWTCDDGASGFYHFDGSVWSRTAVFGPSSKVDLSGSTLATPGGTAHIDGDFRLLGGNNLYGSASSTDFALWNGSRCVPETPGACSPGTRGNDTLIKADSSGASISEFTQPATYQPADVLVIDTKHSRILKTDPNGTDTEVVSEGGFMSAVRDVSVAPDGNIIAIDTGVDVVFEIEPQTGIQTLITAHGLLNRPRAVIVEPDGNILVAEERQNIVLRIDPQTGAQSQLNQATTFDAYGVAKADDGSILATDRNGGQVLQLDPATGAETIIASGLISPQDGDLDESGRYVLAETGAAQVVAIDPALPGSSPLLISQDPQLISPQDVAVESDGMLLVTSSSAGLFRIDPASGIAMEIPLVYEYLPGSFSNFSGDFLGLTTLKAHCSDGWDNDGDGLTDSADPDCIDAADRSEAPVDVLANKKISDTSGYLSAPGSPGTDPGGFLDDSDLFGLDAKSPGDLDGDGIPDLGVGAPFDDDGGLDRGAIHFLMLNADGTVKARQKISDTAGGFPGGLDDSDAFGFSLEWLGDLDGDGVEDLAVGARGDDDGGNARGAAWILFMNADRTVKGHQKISDTAGGFTGVLDNTDRFGMVLASLGDLDGDSVADLAVGSPKDDDGGSGRGAVWILFLNADGTVKSHQKISDTAGGFSGVLDNLDQFGTSVDVLGDMDGDGVVDLAVGTNTDDDGGQDRGAVWILFMHSDGTVKGHQKISTVSGGFTGALQDDDYFGDEVEALGDLDGDGVTELAVGATGDDDGAAEAGAVWILFLNADGTVKNQVKISETSGGFTGDLDALDVFGFTLATLDDMNADGVPELAAGAWLDDDGGTDRGAMWVLFLGNLNAVCGDGLLQTTEQCDDKNLIPGDGCSAVCVVEFCGDGLLQPGLGEACDDGNSLVGDGCSDVCQVEFCGDGVIQQGLGEACDDGGATALDGCGTICELESYLQILGNAAGGAILFTVQGVPLSIASVDVLTLEQVAAAVALEINNDSTLTILGISAGTDGNIVYTNGVLTNVSTTDAGLIVSTGLGPPAQADGDINLDGLVNVADILIGHQVLTGSLTLTPMQLAHGDVAPLAGGIPSPDGQFTVGDLLLIQRKVLGLVDF